MRLNVFDTIDEALALLSENKEFYQEIEREIEQYLIAVFKESSEMIIDINSRVKSRESLREKIIRNRFYVENDSAQGILDNLSDLIGFIIECRFIEDEYNVLNKIRETLNIRNEEDGFYIMKSIRTSFLTAPHGSPRFRKTALRSIVLTAIISRTDKRST